MASVIDPTGVGQDVDFSYGTAETTLEARSDLRVLSNFTGFETGDNVVSFTNSYPDLQFSWTAGSGSYGAGATNSQYATGDTGDSFMAQRGPDTTTGGSHQLTIRFGTWDGSTFTNDRTVAAAGFVFTNHYEDKQVVVTFLDSSSNTLATYNPVGASDPGGIPGTADFYFGWDADAQITAEIASININFIDSATEFGSGIDDIAFAAVPEPSVAGLIASFSLLTLLRRRR